MTIIGKSGRLRGWRPILYLVIASLVVAMISARQPVAPYREVPAGCEAASDDCSRAMIKQWKDRWLALLEITDAGDFHDVVSVTKIMSRIGRESREADALIVTFVHGWNHNASDRDDNLVEFEALLAQLAQREARDRGEKARRVIGVYIGWRGSSIGSTPLWVPTFWSRKAVAEDIGHSAVTVFATLNEIWTEGSKLCRQGGKPSDTRMLTIGHSFGGLIVSRAVLPLLSKGVAEARGDGKQFRGFGDLVVLINPAIEASAFLGLRSLLREYPSTRTKYPNLLVVTSDADWATRYAFPAGRLLTVWDRSVPAWNDWRLMLETIGHIDEFRTHDLSARPIGPRSNQARSPLLVDRTSRTEWLSTGYRYSDTPFWLVKTDESVVRHHSDFSDTLRGFVGTLFSDIASGAAAAPLPCNPK